MSITSMMDVLRPKTKTSAVVTLISCAVFVITYLIWTDYFVIASIYIAVYAPLLLVLFIVFDLLFSSIYKLWTTSKVKVTSESVKTKSNTTPKTGITNMLSMEEAI